MLFSKYFFKINVYIALSLIVACGPGYYKEKTDASSNVFCSVYNKRQRDACLPCPGETIKPNTGDSDYCPEDCEEDGKVANTEHTACGKFTSLYYMYNSSTVTKLSKTVQNNDSNYRQKWRTSLRMAIVVSSIVVVSMNKITL